MIFEPVMNIVLFVSPYNPYSEFEVIFEFNIDILALLLYTPYFASVINELLISLFCVAFSKLRFLSWPEITELFIVTDPL